jgi:hypothetical protein
MSWLRAYAGPYAGRYRGPSVGTVVRG